MPKFSFESCFGKCILYIFVRNRGHLPTFFLFEHASTLKINCCFVLASKWEIKCCANHWNFFWTFFPFLTTVFSWNVVVITQLAVIQKSVITNNSKIFQKENWSGKDNEERSLLTMSFPSAEQSLRDWFLASNTTLIMAQIWFRSILTLIFSNAKVKQELPRWARCNPLGSDWFHSSACSQTMHKSCRRTCSWITLIYRLNERTSVYLTQSYHMPSASASG